MKRPLRREGQWQFLFASPLFEQTRHHQLSTLRTLDSSQFARRSFRSFFAFANRFASSLLSIDAKPYVANASRPGSAGLYRSSTKPSSASINVEVASSSWKSVLQSQGNDKATRATCGSSPCETRP